MNFFIKAYGSTCFRAQNVILLTLIRAFSSYIRSTQNIGRFYFNSNTRAMLASNPSHRSFSFRPSLPAAVRRSMFPVPFSGVPLLLLFLLPPRSNKEAQPLFPVIPGIVAIRRRRIIARTFVGVRVVRIVRVRIRVVRIVRGRVRIRIRIRI